MEFNIKSLQALATRIVWETPLDTMPWAERFGITILRFVHVLIRDLVDGQLTLRAMGLVYISFLAVVPFLAVSFSVLKGFGVHNQIEPMLLTLLEDLGDKGIEITRNIIGFVDNIKVGVLGSLGLALLFYTVISLLQRIERAFNYIWRVVENRPLSQRFSDYLSVVLVGPVLLFSAIGMRATVENASVVQKLMEYKVFGKMLEVSGTYLPYLLIIVAFTFIYVLVPNTKVKFRAALVGGIAAGTMWVTTGWFFGEFIANSAKYTAIYSAFASLIVLMIWLYLNWLILLIGCSVAYYFQNPEQCNLQSRIIRLSNRMKEKMALLIMSLVGQNFYQNRDPWTLEGLAKQLHVGSDACGLLTKSLVSAGLLVTTSDQPPSYMPAHSLETIGLKEIVNAVRTSGETANLSLKAMPSSESIDLIYSNIEESIDGSLGERNLRDLSLAESKNDAILPEENQNNQT